CPVKNVGHGQFKKGAPSFQNVILERNWERSSASRDIPDSWKQSFSSKGVPKLEFGHENCGSMTAVFLEHTGSRPE
ncbi:MAG: hypothetical protein ACE5HO_20655, partial [bacterium]